MVYWERLALNIEAASKLLAVILSEEALYSLSGLAKSAGMYWHRWYWRFRPRGREWREEVFGRWKRPKKKDDMTRSFDVAEFGV